VAKVRLTGLGLADERPVADNKTAQGRQQNRRVEVQIKANEKMQQQAARQG
jgi:flagellar motor protein MotB